MAAHKFPGQLLDSSLPLLGSVLTAYLALRAVTQAPMLAKPGENEAGEAGQALLAVAKVTGFVLDKHCCAFLALWHFEWNQTKLLKRQNKWERGEGKGQTSPGTWE